MTKIERSKLAVIAATTTLALGGGTAAVAATAPSKGSGAEAKQERKEQRRDAAQDRHQAALAKALGVSVADLQRAKAEVAKDGRERRAEREKRRAEKQGLTVSDLRDKRADRVAARLAERVKAGTLKQDRADRLVALVREGKTLPAARKALRAEHRGQRLP